jgi:SpoVK/Ycf46/Vps4 family AAA+-type ATPase
VGADLVALATEAASAAVGRIVNKLTSVHQFSVSPEMLQGISITMSDFEVAIPKVQPSAKREG